MINILILFFKKSFYFLHIFLFYFNSTQLSAHYFIGLIFFVELSLAMLQSFIFKKGNHKIYQKQNHIPLPSIMPRSSPHFPSFVARYLEIMRDFPSCI